MILAAELAVGGVWSVEKERRKNSGFLFKHMSDKFQEKLKLFAFSGFPVGITQWFL